MQRSIILLLLLPLSTLVAIAAFIIPPKAEAVIRLSSPNITSLSQGLVGYWPLDGAVTNWATGKTNDLSGNSNTGSLISMSTTTSPVAGKIGGALNFNGTSNYVNLTSPAAMRTDTCTIAAWVKTTSDTDMEMVGAT